MPRLSLLCRNATTFARTGELDEQAFREFLQRFVDAKVGVYLASGGSGEGHALTRDEIRRIYRIGVEVCKGKVQVNANLPEQHTARATREHAAIAIEAGVEIVNIYGPAGWHGYRPTDAEFIAYYDEILSAIKYPVALAPNPVVGYMTKPALIAEVCRKYAQVVAVNFAGLDDDAYFIELKSLIDRDMAYNVPLIGTPNTLALGAHGIIGGEFNIIPRTFRHYLDAYESRKFDQAALVYADLKKFARYVSHWAPGYPRWIKMAMKVLKLPGGEGGLRPPYRMPPEDEVRKFTDGLLELRIPEIDELARAAGLTR